MITVVGVAPLAVHEACNHSHVEVARWFIESGGAAACAHKTNGWTALMVRKLV